MCVRERERDETETETDSPRERERASETFLRTLTERVREWVSE